MVGENFEVSVAPIRIDAKPADAIQQAIDAKGYSLDLAEPYIEDDGSPAVAMVWQRSRLDLETLEDWKKEEPALGSELEKKFFSRSTTIWKYPSRPVLPETDEDLQRIHSDIMRCVDKYVEYPNALLPSVFATWIMGSYLITFAPRSPLWSMFGPTGAGKGQVQDVVKYLAYRGIKLINPTPAVLFRWSDQYRLTFALDELNDKDHESFQQIMNFIKGAFDGTPIPRFNNDSHEVDLFQTQVFIAPSFKDKHPKEDVKNRGLLITMRQNGASKDVIPKEDSPDFVPRGAEFTELRARLMGLRLRALSDAEFIDGYMERVHQEGTPKALGFDRRPKDIAVSLLLPAIMSGEKRSLIKIIKQSTAEARFDNNSTLTALVQHALEDECDGRQGRVEDGTMEKSTIYRVLEIKARLEREMKDTGDLKESDTLETQKVTNALKTLGYRLTRKGGGKNTPTLNLADEQNIQAYASNKALYSLEKDETEAD